MEMRTLRLVACIFILVSLSTLIYWTVKSDDKTVGGVALHSASVSRLTHLVVPFHEKQIDRMPSFLESWVKHSPCVSIDDLASKSGVRMGYKERLGMNIELVFFVGSTNDTSVVEASVLSVYKRLPFHVKQCFAHTYTRSYRLNQTDNGYLLGAKSMFEEFLTGKMLHSPPYYAFYMEPDVKPVRPGWLSWVDAQCRWPSPLFWIKGSQFRGEALPHRSKNAVTKLHINGNAIYNLKDPEFRAYYFDIIIPFLSKNGIKPWKLAYDLFFMTNVLQNADDYSLYQRHLHKFVLSDFIQNRWHVNYTLSEILDDNQSTFLVHGGTMVG